MVAALEEMQDASEFNEAYCASLADSTAPGCQLVEVFNSHGVFLPQLAGEQGLSGEFTLHLIRPARRCITGLLKAAALLRPLGLCGSLGCSTLLRGCRPMP